MSSSAKRSPAGRPAADMGEVGVVYILHFTSKHRHAAHYVGWASDLGGRLAQHARGRGARLTAAVAAAGGSWEIGQCWHDTTRAFERRIHNSHQTRRYCRICQREEFARKAQGGLELASQAEVRRDMAGKKSKAINHGKTAHSHVLKLYRNGTLAKCCLPGCQYAEQWNSESQRYEVMLPTSKQTRANGEREPAWRHMNLWDGGER